MDRRGVGQESRGTFSSDKVMVSALAGRKVKAPLSERGAGGILLVGRRGRVKPAPGLGLGCVLGHQDGNHEWGACATLSASQGHDAVKSGLEGTSLGCSAGWSNVYFESARSIGQCAADDVVVTIRAKYLYGHRFILLPACAQDLDCRSSFFGFGGDKTDRCGV